jgi:hypothetical protein
MLHQRLLEIPHDLEQLFEHMLARIDDRYKSEASDIFCVFFASQSLEEGPRDVELDQVTAMCMSFAIEDDPEDSLVNLSANQI